MWALHTKLRNREIENLGFVALNMQFTSHGPLKHFKPRNCERICQNVTLES